MDYQIRLAWLSMRRNPYITLLCIGGIGLGIAVAMVFVTSHYRLSGNPIPHKSDRLFYVQVDSWDPDRPFDDDDPSEPPNQLTYRDAMAFMESDIPTYKTAMFKSEMTVHPPNAGERPYREDVRLCFGDFFPMFDLPFRYGSGWDRAADDAPEPVVVLADETNQRLFGGENSVGRTLRIEDRDFRIVGVLDPWKPQPKYYDTNNDEWGDAERIYMPFRHAPLMELRSSGNDSGWKGREPGYQGMLDSESVWIQMWVQLDDDAQRDAFLAYLDAYALEQKSLGRFGRPVNSKLRDVMAWLHFQEVVPEEATSLLIISLLFLLICSVNLIGVLLSKFVARAPEIGVRRALGASRRWVFLQHLLECELIGVAGGIVGLLLSAVGLKLVSKLFNDTFAFSLDVNMFLVGLALALLSALVAGVYPAWRICRIQPGVHLKTQ